MCTGLERKSVLCFCRHPYISSYQQVPKQCKSKNTTIYSDLDTIRSQQQIGSLNKHDSEVESPTQKMQLSNGRDYSAKYVHRHCLLFVHTASSRSKLRSLSLPDFIPNLATQLQQVIALGREVTRLVGNLVTIAAKWFLMAAWAELTTTTPDPTRMVIPASVIATSQSPQDSGSKRCPVYTPNCSNCGGNSNSSSDPLDTAGICRSLPGCVCVEVKDPPPYQRNFVMENPLTPSQIQQNERYRLYLIKTLGDVSKNTTPSIDWSVADLTGNIQVSGLVTTHFLLCPFLPEHCSCSGPTIPQVRLPPGWGSLSATRFKIPSTGLRRTTMPSFTV